MGLLLGLKNETGTLEEAVWARLMGAAAVTDVVGLRVYPVVVPQGAARPYVRYFRVSGPRFGVMAGASGLAMGRIQFDCVADRYATAKTLAQALRVLWDGWSGESAGVTIQGCRVVAEDDQYEESLGEGAALVSVDVVVHYLE